MVDMEEVTLEADPRSWEGLTLMPALTTLLLLVAGKVIFREATLNEAKILLTTKIGKKP